MKSSFDARVPLRTKISVLRIVEIVILVLSLLMNLVAKLWLYDLMPSNYLEAFGAIDGGTTQSIWAWMLMPMYLVMVYPVIWIMHGLPDPYYPIYNMAGNNTNAVIIDIALTIIWYCLIVKLYISLKARFIKNIT